MLKVILLLKSDHCCFSIVSFSFCSNCYSGVSKNGLRRDNCGKGREISGWGEVGKSFFFLFIYLFIIISVI